MIRADAAMVAAIAERRAEVVRMLADLDAAVQEAGTLASDTERVESGEPAVIADAEFDRRLTALAIDLRRLKVPGYRA